MIEIKDFRPFKKNTLQGFVTVRLPAIGPEIRDICRHEKNERRWLAMPANPHQKADGARSWSYILDFFDKDRGQRFQELTLAALDQ